MTTFMIRNTKSGHTFGLYEASDERDALEVLARDAGYRSWAEACEVAPVADGEIAVREATAADLEALPRCALGG